MLQTIVLDFYAIVVNGFVFCFCLRNCLSCFISVQDANDSLRLCDSKYVGNFDEVTNDHEFVNEVSFCDNYDNQEIDVFAPLECDNDDKFKSSACENVGTPLKHSFLEQEYLENRTKWNSYRSPQSKLEDHYEHEESNLNDDSWYERKVFDDIKEKKDVEQEDPSEACRDVEDMMSNMQIDMSLTTVLARVSAYKVSELFFIPLNRNFMQLICPHVF